MNGISVCKSRGSFRRFAWISLFAVATILLLSIPAQAAISWVATGATASSTGSNNRNLVVPTVVNDDLLVAHVAIRGSRTITPPAGWTLIDQVYVSNARITQGVYYKVGLASDSGTTLNWAFNGSDDNAGVIRAYRGVDPSAPIGNFSANINGGNSSSTLTALSVATAAANEWIATFYGVADGDANPLSTPGGMTERYDFDNGGGGGGLSLAGDDEARPTAGATGDRLSTSSVSDRYVAQLVALKPISSSTVTSINCSVSCTAASGAIVSWTVTFSTSVSGLSSSNFALVNSGLGGAPAITGVSGSGTTWTVTASTGTGSGTLGLNMANTTGVNPAVTNLPFTGQVYSVVPRVSSINRASANPTTPGSAVAWTVTFSTSVTGVDASDFALAPVGVSGASVTSVTGSGTTWTVNANTGSGGGTLGLNLVDNDSIVGGSTPLGGSGVGNGNFTGQVYTVTAPFCSQPSNTPAGLVLTCVCDTFGRASLNPSTIFGGNWSLSNSEGAGGTNAYINAGTGLLRLTENTANNAKAATVPGIFPAAGNYISAEFLHYAYNGTNPGADGIAVTLSDYSIPAVPGGFGGSLGYAQRNDGVLPPGFAGGWVGVALDEWGNYQNPTEGRVLGSGFIAQSVGVRGPGNGANGYRWMGGSASNPGGLSIDNRASTTPAPGYMYQVIVDARDYGAGTINVSVNRDSTTANGTTYAPVFGPFNAYTEANFARTQGWISSIVPNYWKVSFTGSTGGANNIHEIGSLRICAETVYPPTGGTASGFSAIDDAYPGAPTVPAYPNFQTGHIYTKLAGTPFQLWVAALTASGISVDYSRFSNKYVQVKLVDNSDPGASDYCGPDSARTCNASCANKAGVEAGATQIAAFPSASTTGVASPKPTFTVNSAYKNLVAVMKECTTSACTAFTATTAACSADSFSVRPTGFSSVASSNATNGGTTGDPKFKAGGQNFALTLTSAGVAGFPSKYTGIAQINNAAIQVVAPGIAAGYVTPATFPAATSGTGSSTATGSTFTYSEVGVFKLLATDATGKHGAYDGAHCTPGPACDAIIAPTWTAIDAVSTENDCVPNSYSNTKDASGKYGCNIGLTADSAPIGRFIPDHFALNGSLLLTTGTIAVSSTSLAVASASGIATGDLLMIVGAGPGSTLLKTTVSAVVGTTVTLATAAAAAVTNANVYTYKASAPTLVTRSDLPLTTGSIGALSTSLTVASDSGIAIGNLLLIPGAGPNGTPLQATVSGVAGTTVTLGSAAWTTVANANVYNTSSQSLFTYLDEPMLVLAPVTALNAAEEVTANYSGGLAKLDAPTLTGGANWMTTACAVGTQCFGFGAIDGTTVRLTSRLAVDASPVSTWVAGVGSFATSLKVSRPTATTPDDTWGPYEALKLGAAPLDADGVTLPNETSGDAAHMVDLDADLSAPVLERRLIATVKERFGRIKLSNAFGSENSPLQVPVQAQYWSGRSWVLNASDSMTLIPPARVALSNYRRNGAATADWSTTASGPGPLAGGTGTLTLSTPAPAGKTGSVDVAINLGTSTQDTACLPVHTIMAIPTLNLAYLRAMNGSCAASSTFAADPSATATFGVYSPENRRAVHIRELF